VITFLKGAVVVRKNKLSGHREEKGVSRDLQGGVQTLESDIFGSWTKSLRDIT